MIKGYTTVNNVDFIHYEIKTLRKFISDSYEGVAGALLIRRDNRNHLSIYRVSGTYDKPYPVSKMSDLFTFTIKHFPLMDGEWKSTEELVKHLNQYYG